MELYRADSDVVQTIQEIGLDTSDLGQVNLIRERHGNRLLRVTIEGSTYILKVFGDPDASREIEAYTLLTDLRVPTIRSIGKTTNALLFEDLEVSRDLRLAQEADVTEAEVGVALAAWYRSLHDAGSRLQINHAEKPSFLWREIDELTPASILEVAAKVGADRPKWVILADNIEGIKNAAMTDAETLTYNDFHWTNLALSRNEKHIKAVVFDYHLLGLGLRYSDCRNVTGSLGHDAADAFQSAYGATDPVEKILDDLLAPLYALVVAFRRSKFPSWAEQSLNLAKTGEIHNRLDQAMEVCEASPGERAGAMGDKSEAYPLEHWLSRIQPLPPTVTEAVKQALQIEDPIQEQDLGGSAKLVTLTGAGNHSVFGLHVDESAYCLKRLRRTKRPLADIERVLRREVGGMCTLANLASGRAPLPLAWNLSEAWLLCDLLPGIALGNASLTQLQLQELALATQDVCAITPEYTNEPLWDIDWNIVFLLEWLRGSHAELVEKAGDSDACAEAAAITGDWLASSDPNHFLEASDSIVFTRGDQNLANALWDGKRIRFVDLEYCGWNDLPRDLSLVTEHIQSYETPIEAWDWYIDQFDLTPNQHRRTLAGRRRQALSWLAKECLKSGSLRSFPEEKRIERLLSRAKQLCRRKSR